MPEIILSTLIYNRKEYLEDAMYSALKQTLDKSKWVHVFLDNGSVDGSGDFVEEFCKKNNYENSKLIRLDNNLGIQGGHNYILNNVIPKYYPEAKIFSLLESDDMLVENCLEDVYNAFQEHPEIGETYSDFSCINAYGKVLFDVYPNKAKSVDNQFTLEGQKALRQLFNHNPVGHQRSYSIKCLRNIGGFDTRYEYANDVEIAFKMIEKYPIIKIHKVLYVWRDHGNSASQQNKQKQWQEAHEIMDIYMNKWKEKGLI